MMKLVIEGTGITGRKTNHSARKTMVETLCRANIPDSTVMQLSGHKSVQSLNQYKKPPLEQQKSLSHLLSNHCSQVEQSALVSSPSTSGPTAAHVPGPFSNASYTNCSFVLNFGGPSQQVSSYSSSISSSVSTAAPPRRKRPLIIEDSSDED